LMRMSREFYPLLFYLLTSFLYAFCFVLHGP
jgi:hypothetical protein